MINHNVDFRANQNTITRDKMDALEIYHALSAVLMWFEER